MLSYLLGSQLNILYPVNLHIVLGFQIKLDLVYVLVLVKTYHLHRVPLELSFNEILKLFAFFGRPFKRTLSLINDYILAREGQDLDESHPDVLIEAIIEQVLFDPDLSVELHTIEVL
jgi:hypothetical protein